MQINKLSKIFVFSILLITLCKTSVAQEQLQVNVTTLEYPPYINTNLDKNGWMWEVVEKAFALSDVKSRLHIYPWSRALMLVKNSKMDALLLANKTVQREKWALFSDPVGRESFVALKLVSNIIKSKTLTGTKNKSVSVLRGSAQKDYLETLGFKPRVVNTLRQGFMQIKYSRVDFLVADKIALTSTLAKVENIDFKKYEFLPTPLYSTDMHLAVSRKHPQGKTIIKLFNQGLKQLKSSGEYNNILKSYGFN